MVLQGGGDSADNWLESPQSVVGLTSGIARVLEGVSDRSNHIAVQVAGTGMAMHQVMVSLRERGQRPKRGERQAS